MAAIGQAQFTIVDLNDGPQGNSAQIQYIRQQSQPATPTGNTPSGWSTTIPTSGFGNVWFSNCIKDKDGNLVGSWTQPALLAPYTSNLLASHPWTVGTGAYDVYVINGIASENVREIGNTPFGGKDVIWRAVDQDITSDAEGGWNVDITIDHTQMYRASVWVNQLSRAGQVYLGCSTATTNNMDGTANGNPYFVSGITMPTASKWYLLVGYIYGSGATETTSHPLGGIYDGATGLKTWSAQSFKTRVGATVQRHRAYQFYSTTIGTETQFYAPRFDLCDGNEPSIQELLRTGVQGQNGIGVSSIVEQYYLSTSASLLSGGSWSNTVPAWVDGNYMWTRSVITYTDNSTLTTNAVCVTGGKGSTGPTGNGISSVDVEYYLSTSNTTQTGGSWSTTAPAWVDGNYMWSRTKTVYTNSTTVYSNPVCITGAKGATGNTGSTGVGISSITEYYLATSASSGVTTATAGWTTTMQSITSINKYLWNYEKVTYTDSTTVNQTPVIIGAYGDTGGTGSPGKGISSITEYYLATSASSGVTTATAGWSTTVPTITSANKYLWNYEKATYTDSSTTNTTPVIIGAYGDKGDTGNTGVGISSITEYYLATSASSGVTIATGGWSTTIPTITSTNKYLWNYEKVTYTDSSTVNQTPVIIGVYGDTGGTGGTGPAGKGISSITEYYLATNVSTGVTTGTSGWTTTVPTITSTNKYLWNYEKVTYTDASTTSTTPVVIGVYGDKGDTGSPGVGISSITEYYLATNVSTGVTTATSGWSTTVPTITSTNKYLWNYEKVTYTDSSIVNQTPVVIGVYGDTGGTGGTGPAGKGISSITEYYLATISSSGVTTGSSGWTTTVQTVTSSNKYLWNYEKVTYTDSSTTNTTPVIIGVYGDKGDTGNTGSPGNDAITAVLSNEASVIPTDNVGNNGNFTGANTTMTIFKGTVDDSANWTVAASPSSGVGGSLSGKTYTVTSLTVDNGYVDLTASRSGYTSITKRYNLSKSKKGIDANIGYSTNPYFSSWTSTYPDGYAAWAGIPSKETITTFTGGNAMRFNAASGTDMGVVAYLAGGAFGKVPEMSYYTLKFNVYIASATSLKGAGFLIDFTGLKADGVTSTYDRTYVYLEQEISNWVAGKWYQVTKTIPVNKVTWTTWSYLTVYVMANYSGLNTTRDAKDIIFDSIDISAMPFTVDKLSAISANIGNITAGNIQGVTMSLAGGLFVVDSLGNVTFGGKLVGAKGTFSGDLTSETLTIEPASGKEAVINMKIATMSGKTHYTSLRSYFIDGGNLGTSKAEIGMDYDPILGWGDLGYFSIHANLVDIKGGAGTLTATQLYANYLDINGMNSGSNIYIRPSSTGEVRATATNTLDVYVDLRSRYLYANAMDVNTGTHMFLRPSAATSEVRVTVTGSTTTYANFRADNIYAQTKVYANGVALTSSVTEKTNVKEFNEDAIAMVKDLPVYTYHFQDHIDNGDYWDIQVGMLAEQLPPILKGSEFNVVNPYAITSVLWKAVQQQQVIIEDLQKRITEMEEIG